jgi:hypothetical protein
MELENLDLKDIRKYMMDEVNLDVKNDDIYYGNRLKPVCKEDYLNLLKNEIEVGNPNSFSTLIKNNGLLKDVEVRKSGSRAMPSDAHETLGEGEYNRFYIRGLCKKAIEKAINIEIYRAKQVTSPRPKSQMLIGTVMDPKIVLDDFRKNFGRKTCSEIAKPNSGLSFRLVK